MTKAKSTGICHLVGAGPGDLGLVTLRAKECLEAAEVVVYDYLCNPDMLAWAPASAEIIYAGKKPARTPLSRTRSTRCSSTRPAPANASSGSRAVTHLCSAAAAKKRSRSPRHA